MGRIIFTNSFREAFRLRAEHLGLDAVADRATPAQTSVAIDNVLSLLPISANDVLLDIGSGDGQLMERVAPKVRSAIALDITITPLAAIRERLGPCASFHVVCGVSETLPFCEGAFSSVVINSVLYALGSYEEAERTIAEVARVLKPGGYALFGEIGEIDERDNTQDSRGLVSRTWARIRRHGARAIFRRLWDSRKQGAMIVAPNSFLFWSQPDFRALLDKHGFGIERVEYQRTAVGTTTRLHYLAVRR